MLKSFLMMGVVIGAWNVSCVADEPTGDETQEQRVEVRVEKNVTADGDGEAKVTGRIIVVGPDGETKEYSLDEELPEGVRVLVSRDDDAEAHDDIIRYIQKIEDGEVEERLMIGVHCDHADDVLRSHLQLGDAGLIVLEVIDESPAHDAGLQKSDVLFRANGQELTDVDQLVSVVQESEGRAIEFGVVRAGERMEVAATPRKMKPAQRFVFDQLGDNEFEFEFKVDGDEPHAVWMQRLEELDLPEEALEALKKGRAGVRIRNLTPGVVIDRNSRPEDIEKLVEEARERAAAEMKRAVEARRHAEDHRREAIRHRIAAEDHAAGAQEHAEHLRARMKELEDEIARLKQQLEKLSEKDRE